MLVGIGRTTGNEAVDLCANGVCGVGDVKSPQRVEQGSYRQQGKQGEHGQHGQPDQKDQKGQKDQQDQHGQQEKLTQLKRSIEQVQTGMGIRLSERIYDSGFRQLNNLLPSGGVPSGAVLEWIDQSFGGGAGCLGLQVAWHVTLQQVADQRGVLVVVDAPGCFYPPAAATLGVELSHVLVVRPACEQDHFWVLDQLLRCAAVGAVWSRIERIPAKVYRRLQLASEQSQTTLCLVRSHRWRNTPSWAQIRCLVQPQPGKGDWRAQVQLFGGTSVSRSCQCELEMVNRDWAPSPGQKVTRGAKAEKDIETAGSTNTSTNAQEHVESEHETISSTDWQREGQVV